jgi:hypothetical protein
MEVYSSNTSEVIRHDFLKYQRRTSASRPQSNPDITVRPDDKIRESFDRARAEMADDNGRGSYATYKCPIF